MQQSSPSASRGGEGDMWEGMSWSEMGGAFAKSKMRSSAVGRGLVTMNAEVAGRSLMLSTRDNFIFKRLAGPIRSPSFTSRVLSVLCRLFMRCRGER